MLQIGQILARMAQNLAPAKPHQTSSNLIRLDEFCWGVQSVAHGDKNSQPHQTSSAQNRPKLIKGILDRIFKILPKSSNLDPNFQIWLHCFKKPGTKCRILKNEAKFENFDLNLNILHKF